MKSILLIIACITIVMLVISKCNTQPANTKPKRVTITKKVKDSHRFLPEETNIWPVPNY